ncbi:MAG: hypothetical protein ACRDWI_12095 [Jiangellaceae bacterium]
MTTAMNAAVRLAEQAGAAEGVPSLVWGLGALGILLTLLLGTLVFGKGRPHA